MPERGQRAGRQAAFCAGQQAIAQLLQLLRAALSVERRPSLTQVGAHLRRGLEVPAQHALLVLQAGRPGRGGQGDSAAVARALPRRLAAHGPAPARAAAAVLSSAGRSSSSAVPSRRTHLVHLLRRRVVQHLQALWSHDAQAEGGLREQRANGGMRQEDEQGEARTMSKPPRRAGGTARHSTPQRDAAQRGALTPTLNAGSSKHGNARRAELASNWVVASVCSVPPRPYVLLRPSQERGRAAAQLPARNALAGCPAACRPLPAALRMHAQAFSTHGGPHCTETGAAHL